MDQDTAPDLSHAQFLRIALDALTARAARWLTLVLAFVLFGYCMLEPTWLRLATAAGFTVLIHVPLWWRRDKEGGASWRRRRQRPARTCRSRRSTSATRPPGPAAAWTPTGRRRARTATPPPPRPRRPRRRTTRRRRRSSPASSGAGDGGARSRCGNAQLLRRRARRELGARGRGSPADIQPAHLGGCHHGRDRGHGAPLAREQPGGRHRRGRGRCGEVPRDRERGRRGARHVRRQPRLRRDPPQEGGDRAMTRLGFLALLLLVLALSGCTAGLAGMSPEQLREA